MGLFNPATTPVVESERELLQSNFSVNVEVSFQPALTADMIKSTPLAVGTEGFP